MPIYNDIRLLDEELKKHRARAYLLVFATDLRVQESLAPLIQDLYTVTTAARQRVAIFFPIRREPDDVFNSAAWTRHNPDAKSFKFILLDRDGVKRAEFASVPTREQILADIATASS